MPKVRFQGVLGWARMGGAQAMPVLLQALRDDAAMVRRLAARELGRRKNAAALQALVNTLQQDMDVWVREAAARALGDLGHRGALPALQTVARNKQEMGLVREAAAQAIQRINRRQKVRQQP
ncbi:MAG: HEAT repeat domain-containing protein [bacterium]